MNWTESINLVKLLPPIRESQLYQSQTIVSIRDEKNNATYNLLSHSPYSSKKAFVLLWYNIENISWISDRTDA